MKLYNSNSVEQLKAIYEGGKIGVIVEGCLLEFQLAIFYKKGKKYAIVKDKFLNSWSSAYIIKFYNKLPKKYQEMRIKRTIKL